MISPCGIEVSRGISTGSNPSGIKYCVPFRCSYRLRSSSWEIYWNVPGVVDEDDCD
ncbi:14517_t:CDS:2 [Entrophospora sp. SA101]|nr:14517_t:CDS:2 [Entrophospora sp. SA101]